MGGKKSKQAGGKEIKVPNKKQGLDSKDLKFLQEQTGMSQEQIKAFYSEFMANNPDGQLDRQEFVRLYAKFRSEPLDRIDEISQYVFRAFDADNNGQISFGEFLVAYALTSRGDVKQKLEYAFEMYDADNNGYLDSAELKTVIHGMLDLLGADEKGNDSNLLAKDTIQQLDKNHDGKIRKDEFVSGCLANYALRSLLSPFS